MRLSRALLELRNVNAIDMAAEPCFVDELLQLLWPLATDVSMHHLQDDETVMRETLLYFSVVSTLLLAPAFHQEKKAEKKAPPKG